MSDWDSKLYLKFKNERTQPAIDLANRLRVYNPKTAADIGCGPGNSTSVLKSVFPESDIIGLDNSENMINKAKNTYPDLKFRLCDVNNLSESYDLLFSNACLQWLPEHDKLIPKLMNNLNEGGVLAVQIPMNTEEPLYRAIAETAEEPEWNLNSADFPVNKTLLPDEYYDVLSGCSSDFSLWETIYRHSLPSHKSLLDWVRATRLRPYLEAVGEEKSDKFENEILSKVEKLYPVMNDGNVLLHFRRFFFVAQK